MPIKVLIVDENAASMAGLRDALTATGARVRTSEQWRDAASVVAQEKFDGIFIALAAEHSPGLHLTHAIRSYSWNKRTPVVVLSTDGGTQARARAFQAGGTFFSPTPTDGASWKRLVLSTRGVMLEERRRAARIPFVTEVLCASGTKKVMGRSINLSRDGLLFQTDGGLVRGLPVSLSFRLEAAEPYIPCRGVVVRVDVDLRAGLRFVPINEEDRQRVREYVAKAADVL